MKQTTRVAGIALAVLAATALPFNAALADRGGRDKGDRYKSDRYSYSYKKPAYRHDHRYKGYDRHHHHHDKRPVYIVAPPRYRRPHHHHHYYGPYWPGSTLGFVYDSFTDSWRIGGSYWLD